MVSFLVGKQIEMNVFSSGHELGTKTTISYSIYKHDAIDIADPSSMQDACHMNFVIDLAHLRVSRAFRIFSLCNARDKTQNISLIFCFVLFFFLGLSKRNQHELGKNPSRCKTSIMP